MEANFLIGGEGQCSDFEVRGILLPGLLFPIGEDLAFRLCWLKVDVFSDEVARLVRRLRVEKWREEFDEDLLVVDDEVVVFVRRVQDDSKWNSDGDGLPGRSRYDAFPCLIADSGDAAISSDTGDEETISSKLGVYITSSLLCR